METELEGQPEDRNKALEEKIKLLQKENELLKSKAKVSLCEYMFCRNSKMDNRSRINRPDSEGLGE